MAYDREVADRVRQALSPQPSVREVTMFGGLSFMVNERIVVSVMGDGALLVRADPQRADELLAIKGASPAEMGTGRPMGRGWITVAREAVATHENLGFWIGVALEHNRIESGKRSRHSGAD